MEFVIHYAHSDQPKVARVPSGKGDRFALTTPTSHQAFVVRDAADLSRVPTKTIVALLNAAREKKIKQVHAKDEGVEMLWPLLPKLAVSADVPSVESRVKLEEPAPKASRAPAVKPAAAAEQVDRPKRKPGVCAFIAERLRAGDDTDAVLIKLREQFPASKAKAGDVSIVRRKVASGAM